MAPISTADRERARQTLRALGNHPKITTDDGKLLEFPASLVEPLSQLLESVADGEPALVLRSTKDLTTEQAATVLGVSRPTVVRLVGSGKIPARMVGTHRRLALADVLAYREASAGRPEALDAMARGADALESDGSTLTPLSGDEFLARVLGAPPPTVDDVSITLDGRRLDSKEAVLAWLAEVEAERAAGRFVNFE
ncbi:MAG: helix-turn-helix domain-containing protein [Acidimicrobiales bacterium]